MKRYLGGLGLIIELFLTNYIFSAIPNKEQKNTQAPGKLVAYTDIYNTAETVLVGQSTAFYGAKGRQYHRSA